MTLVADSGVRGAMWTMKSLLAGLCLCLACGVVAADQSPPELWSSIKDLARSKQACEIQSALVLQKMRVSNLVENRNGLYGNVKSNRVVVKCIPIAERTSKLMVAVAGHDRDAVRLIRDTLVAAIQ